MCGGIPRSRGRMLGGGSPEAGACVLAVRQCGSRRPRVPPRPRQGSRAAPVTRQYLIGELPADRGRIAPCAYPGRCAAAPGIAGQRACCTATRHGAARSAPESPPSPRSSHRARPSAGTGHAAGNGCGAACRWPGTRGGGQTGMPPAPATAAGPHPRSPWPRSITWCLVMAGTVGGISARTGGPLRLLLTVPRGRGSGPARHGTLTQWMQTGDGAHPVIAARETGR